VFNNGAVNFPSACQRSNTGFRAGMRGIFGGHKSIEVFIGLHRAFDCGDRFRAYANGRSGVHIDRKGLERRIKRVVGSIPAAHLV